MEEWLLASEQVVRALKLSRVPDYSTLCRMFKRIGMSRFLNFKLVKKRN